MTSGDRPGPSLFDREADLFRLLGNPVHIRILEMLRDGGERTMDQLRDGLGPEPRGMDDHFAAMRSLLESRHDGASVLYRAKDRRIFQLLELATEVLTTRPSAPPPVSGE